MQFDTYSVCRCLCIDQLSYESSLMTFSGFNNPNHFETSHVFLGKLQGEDPRSTIVSRATSRCSPSRSGNEWGCFNGLPKKKWAWRFSTVDPWVKIMLGRSYCHPILFRCSWGSTFVGRCYQVPPPEIPPVQIGHMVKAFFGVIRDNDGWTITTIINPRIVLMNIMNDFMHLHHLGSL